MLSDQDEDRYNFGGLRMKRWTNDGKNWVKIPPSCRASEPKTASVSHWGLYPSEIDQKLTTWELEDAKLVQLYEGRHAQKLNSFD